MLTFAWIIELSWTANASQSGIRLPQHKGLFYFYLFGVLRRFQHCTGHITTGSWKGRGNQYIQFIRVPYCKLPTNGKQLPAFPLEVVPGSEPSVSEVGGESVTTLPPWPPTSALNVACYVLLLVIMCIYYAYSINISNCILFYTHLHYTYVVSYLWTIKCDLHHKL